MNQRLQDLHSQYSNYVSNQLETQRALLLKLHFYEKLRPEQYCLADLSLDEILEALPLMENDPQKIWNYIEKHFGKHYFDSVVVKIYGNLFEDRDEKAFHEDLKNYRQEVKNLVEEQA